MHLREAPSHETPLNFLPPDTINKELFDQLLQIRKVLEMALPGFPILWCAEAAGYVQSKTGLLMLGGYVYTPNGLCYKHFWNAIPFSRRPHSDQRLYVDLTYNQFDASLPPVAIIDSDSTSKYISTWTSAELLSYTLKPEILALITECERKLGAQQMPTSS